MKTNLLAKNVGEWLQISRSYFCISPHKIAPLRTPEAPCLTCTKALLHWWGVRTGKIKDRGARRQCYSWAQ